MEPDPVYIARPGSLVVFSRKGVGMGLFCTQKGQWTFDWTFPDKRISYMVDKSDKSVNLTKLQKVYQVNVGGSDNVVWVSCTKAGQCVTVTDKLEHELVE